MKFLFLLSLGIQILVGLEIEKANTYTKQNIDGWVMSEKLDGIRAIWTGKQLLSKNGNPIYAPSFFTKNFPPFFLDGELYTKPNDFENIQSIVLDYKPGNQWKQIRYNIFEVPYEKGDFFVRLQKAKHWFNKNPNQYIQFIPQLKCNSKQQLDEYLKTTINKKGEGVMIKNPHLSYTRKRHSGILKVKTFDDMEGEIIGINYRDNGEIKSLTLKLKNSIIFNLGGGFSNRERKASYTLGEQVTFKYYGLTKKGKPKFASFLRIRKKE